MRNSLLIFISWILLTNCQSSTNSVATSDTDTTETVIAVNEPDTDVALTFINGYVENCNKMSEAESAMDWVHPNMSASVSFKNELNRVMEEAYEADPEMGLGFDPLFNAQDYPEEGFVLESLDAETGFLTVVGKDWNDFKLTMKLVYDDNEWLVDGCGIINVPIEKQAGLSD